MHGVSKRYDLKAISSVAYDSPPFPSTRFTLVIQSTDGKGDARSLCHQLLAENKIVIADTNLCLQATVLTLGCLDFSTYMYIISAEVNLSNATSA